jgi:hypothetical protein
MVVVEGWSYEGETGHELHQVLALEVRIGATFSRGRRPKDHRRPPTPGIAEAEGWAHEHTYPEYDVLVVRQI